MNHSNDPILVKNLAAVKQATFLHHRKFSQQTNLARKTLEKIDSFAKEPVSIVNKTKQVGKIRRNSIATTNQQNTKSKQTNENDTSGFAIDKWLNDELLSKIRCSQIVNRPQKSITSVLKQSNKPNQAQKITINRNTKSVSTHYQTHYTNLIKQYQKKKQKINHEIESLRKTQPIKLQNTHQIDIGNSLNNETPKFGNYISQSQKIIFTKSQIKTTKDPKIVQFLNAIKYQIDLQAKLRTLKHRIPKEEQQKITSILKTQYGIDQDLTKMDSDQFDPFAQRKQLNTEALVSQLANAHLAADQNWNKNIKNNFEQATLQEIFTSLSNGNQTMTISLISFVREIGILLQNQKYFRNRDLYRIHKRITPFRREIFINLLGKNRNK